MRSKLELQADRIEATLKLHDVDASVTGGAVTPRWIRFKVLPANAADSSNIKGLNGSLAAALDVPNCRVSRRGAVVAIEVPRDDPRPVRLLPLYRQLTEISSFTATLGLTEDGAPLLIRLPSPNVGHILVTGDSGSGKTTLLQSIILSLAMSNSDKALSFVLVDPKRSVLHSLDALPHLARPVIRGQGDFSEVFQSLVRLMHNRRGRLRTLFPHVVVVIDDADDLLTGANAASVQESLTRLLQRGREVGIYVIAATQKPAVIDSLTNAKFLVRLVGQTSNATGVCGADAMRLLGKGDFLAVAEGNQVRFQAAHASPEEIQTTVQHIVSELTIEAVLEAPSDTTPGLPILVTKAFDEAPSERVAVR